MTMMTTSPIAFISLLFGMDEMRRRRRRRRRNSLLCYHDGDDDEEECTHIEIDDLPLIYVRWLAVHILSHFMCNVMAVVVVVFVPVSSSLREYFGPSSLLSLSF